MKVFLIVALLSLGSVVQAGQREIVELQCGPFVHLGTLGYTNIEAPQVVRRHDVLYLKFLPDEYNPSTHYEMLDGTTDVMISQNYSLVLNRDQKGNILNGQLTQAAFKSTCLRPEWSLQ